MLNILGQDSVFMEKRKPPEAIHTWLIRNETVTKLLEANPPHSGK
jgi:hypothetical protein